MDTAGKQNVSMFLGAMFSIGTFWLVLGGLASTSPLQLLGGVACLAGAIASFRFYRQELQRDRGDGQGH